MIADKNIRKHSYTPDSSIPDQCLPFCSLNLSPYLSTTNSCSSSQQDSGVHSLEVSNMNKDIFQKQTLSNLRLRILKLSEQKIQMDEKFKAYTSEIQLELQAKEKENQQLKVVLDGLRQDMKDMRSDVMYLRNRIHENSSCSIEQINDCNNQKKLKTGKKGFVSLKAIKLFKTSSVKVK